MSEKQSGHGLTRCAVSVGEPSLPTDAVVELGPLRIRIVSDTPSFPAMCYFGSDALVAGERSAVDFELICLSDSSLVDRFSSFTGPDETARSRSFRTGYYVTDHFGPAIDVMTRGNRIIVVGPRLENIVWPYFVKYFLLRHTVETGGVFLKAGAVALAGSASLVVGRGGAGKTVFVSTLCRYGASFVTNSHAVVRDGAVYPMATSMRIRPGPWLEFSTATGAAALNPDEVVIDPRDVFPQHCAAPVTVRNICVIDYRSGQSPTADPVGPDESYDILEQFALGLNVYRLEEDLLDHLDGQYGGFAATYRTMKEQLAELAKTCRTFRISMDVTQPRNRAALFELLAADINVV